MDLYSVICRNVVTPLWSIREKSPYLKHFKHLSACQYDAIDVLQARQLERLKQILHHAYDNVPYYRSRWQEINFYPQDLKNLNDLAKLPVLTKEDIRRNKDDLVASNIPQSQLEPRKTSGSTGVSLEFYVDDDCQQWKRGCALMRDQWSGWKLGEKIAAIWGNPTHRVNWKARVRNLLLERFDYLDTLKMGEKEMFDFYRRQLRRKPALLFGHAHSLYLFSLFLKTKGLTPFHVNGIISTCMVLHQHERKLVEETFGCKILNRYGCEEVSLIASECEQHSGLHLNSDSLVVEFIKDEKPVQAGEPGAIVVTDLINKGMPFIRYKVGDVGIPSNRTCSCGRSYPLIESVEGRIADYVVTPEGNYISGISLTENFAMHLPEVKQMQIVQEKIDKLLFKIVKGETFTVATEEKIAKLAEERFGKSMKHSIEYVDQIPQEASGKYRFCISNVQNPFS